MAIFKNILQALALSYILILIISTSPALGISVSFGTNGVSSSANYHLDASTSLRDVGVLGDGTISRTIEVSGSGNNELSDETSVKGASVNALIKSSGILSATTSVIASSEGALLNQDVDGSGDLAAVISGSKGSVAVSQNAEAANGVLSTQQNVATDGNVMVAGQDTQITGDSGGIRGEALSSENLMVVEAGGILPGDVDTELLSTSANMASVHGGISINGLKYIDEETLEYVDSNSGVGFGRSSTIARADKNPSSFDTRASNIALSTFNGVYIPPGNPTGNLDAYEYLKSKWYTSGSSYKGLGSLGNGVQMKLNTNLEFFNRVKLVNEKGYPIGTATREGFRSAVGRAEKTWDDALPYTTLFTNIGNTDKQPTTRGDDYTWIPDYTNVIGWRDLGGNNNGVTTAAWTTWWTSGLITSKNGQGALIDVDIAFNSNPALSWVIYPHGSSKQSARLGQYDVETNALHELGHAIGMAHPYFMNGNVQTTNDRSEIMNQDNTRALQVQHTLGVGDDQGINLLYPGKGDLNNDGQITQNEVIDAINKWQSGAVSVSYPVHYINLWSKS